jgi:hypothetical protein
MRLVTEEHSADARKPARGGSEAVDDPLLPFSAELPQ